MMTEEEKLIRRRLSNKKWKENNKKIVLAQKKRYYAKHKDIIRSNSNEREKDPTVRSNTLARCKKRRDRITDGYVRSNIYSTLKQRGVIINSKIITSEQIEIQKKVIMSKRLLKLKKNENQNL